MSGRRKEKPPATWLRAILDEGKPPTVSEVPMQPDPTDDLRELRPAKRKRLIKRLVAWLRLRFCQQRADT